MTATPDHPAVGVTPESIAGTSGDRAGAHTEREALRAIQAILDGVEWSADSLAAIAAILEEAGYPVRDTADIVTLTGHRQ
jgi:hypothetical protein